MKFIVIAIAMIDTMVNVSCIQPQPAYEEPIPCHKERVWIPRIATCYCITDSLIINLDINNKKACLEDNSEDAGE